LGRLKIVFIALFFLFSLENTYAVEKMNIEIVPLGSIDNSILDYLKKDLSDIFDAEVYLSESRSLPEYAYNKKRGQYLSSQILDSLSKSEKGLRQKVIAVINKDLYVPGLNFVFGQADPVKGICVISLTRLYPSYYGLKEERDLLLKRILKEAVHEIGHLFNLSHCPNPVCVMHFSNSLSDTDKKDYWFCDNCKSLLAASKSNTRNYGPAKNKGDVR